VQFHCARAQKPQTGELKPAWKRTGRFATCFAEVPGRESKLEAAKTECRYAAALQNRGSFSRLRPSNASRIQRNLNPSFKARKFNNVPGIRVLLAVGLAAACITLAPVASQSVSEGTAWRQHLFSSKDQRCVYSASPNDSWNCIFHLLFTREP
jgi:hypothetical protein